MNIELENLPETWERVTLDNVFDYIQRGKSPRYANTSKLPIINQKCIRWNGIQEEHLKYWDDNEIAALTPERFLKSEDILWNSTGTGTIGRACLFRGLKNGSDIVADSHVTVLRHNQNVDPAYFFYYIMSPYVQRNIEAMQAGSTGQVELGREVIRSTLAPLAPINEQKRIVEKIEELFSQIDAGEAALKKAQALIKRYRQSLLRAAVTGELTKEWREKNAKKYEAADELLARILIERRAKFKGRGKYDEPLPAHSLDNIDLPKNWTVASIDQISTLVQYGSSAKCGGDTQGIPVLRMGNLGFGQIDLTNLKYLPKQHDEFPGLILDDGDLLFNRTNSAELVGKTAVYSSKMGEASFASYLIRVKFHLVDPQYVAYFINSTYGRQWISRVVSQQVGQANVNGTKLRALTIPLPPLEEQKAIIDAVEERFTSIDHLLDELEHKALLSSSLRQSILKAAFSGQLVPQDPNDEPASVLLERIKAERETGEVSKTKHKAKTNAEPKSRKRAAA